MTSTTTTGRPRRTIDADVFRRARAAGASVPLAAYVARPAVLDLTWHDHYQSDETWADFEQDGRRFRATLTDPTVTEGRCESCAELVDAWRRQDDGVAWLTDDEYESMTHRVVTVAVLDDDGDVTEHDASLWGTCGLDRTEVERLSDERYLAETVADLADEAARLADAADERKRAADDAARGTEDARRRGITDRIAEVAQNYGADLTGMVGDFRDEIRSALGWGVEDDQTGG